MKLYGITGLLFLLLLVGGVERSCATPCYYTFEVVEVLGNWHSGLDAATIQGHKYIFYVDTDLDGVLYRTTGNGVLGQFFARLLSAADLERLGPKFLQLVGVDLDVNNYFDCTKYGNILEDKFSKNDHYQYPGYLGKDYGWQGLNPYTRLESSSKGWGPNYLSGSDPLSIGKFFTMSDYGEVDKGTYGQSALVQTKVALTHITPVPEPTTIFLFGAGLAATAVGGSRREKRGV